ncbi:energy-coupling factor transporter transmembrane protein EcfT [Candidatus Thorarchaeota archaeon]|nr:MAG: energy-coupling factor transporter transmembrane protein EcfT [Candidatus Thorarchaeota archaeon]
MSTRFGFVRRESTIHNLNPAMKLFSLIFLMISILAYPSWVLSGLLFLVILMSFRVARVPIRISSNRVRFLVIFSLILLLFQVILTPNGIILAYFVPRIGDVGPFIPITSFGLERGLSISLRFLLIVFSSMLFISVTNPTLLAHSLTKFRIPYRYSFALVIALRFLPLFDMETNLVRMSQKSRGISSEIGGLKKILRTIRYTFYPLLVSALSRVETLSLSMDGRGFGYRPERSYLRESTWSKVDFLVMALSVGLLFFSFLLALGMFPELSAIL